jgi:D-glycerate 3-kinase
MNSDTDPNIKIRKKYLSFLKKQVAQGEPFYNKIEQLYKFYLPICDYIYKSFRSKKKLLIIGLSGGQGSGKTTITQILKLILKNKFNLNIINISIDDFYKTLHQRKKMAKNVHKLFLTRGVPGSHDLVLLNKCFKNLLNKKFKSFFIPQFDKSFDNRKNKKHWIKVKKKPDIVIFEGWCVGAKSQNKKDLKKPINYLEKNEDKDLIWRTAVNNELKIQYKKLFRLIDKLIFLQVPNFRYVLKWRLLQENKLKNKSKGKKIMSHLQIKKFIMFYERITKQMLKKLKIDANIVIKLDKKHRLNAIRFN